MNDFVSVSNIFICTSCLARRIREEPVVDRHQWAYTGSGPSLAADCKRCGKIVEPEDDGSDAEKRKKLYAGECKGRA